MSGAPPPVYTVATGPEKIRRQNAGEVIDLLSRDTFSRLLECQVCQEIPLPPIYICTNGHNICSYCHSRLKKCGLCSAKFPNTRNLTVENIINSCTFACMYESEGCRDVIKGEDMKKHITNCSSKPPPEFEALASPRHNTGDNSSSDDDTDTDEGFQFTGTNGPEGVGIFSGFARIAGLFDNNNHSDSSINSMSSISTTSGNTSANSSTLSFHRPAGRRSISLARLFRSPRSPTPPRPRPTGTDENFPRPMELSNNTESTSNSSLRVELRDLFNNRGGGLLSPTRGPTSSSSSSSSSSSEGGIVLQQPMRGGRNRERGAAGAGATAIIIRSVRGRDGRLVTRASNVHDPQIANININIPPSTRSTATRTNTSTATSSTSNVPSSSTARPGFPYSFSLRTLGLDSRNNNSTATVTASAASTSTATAPTRSFNDFSPLALRTRSRSNASTTSSSSSSRHSNGRLFSSSSASDSHNEETARSRSPIINRRILRGRGRRGVGVGSRRARSRQRLNLTPTSPFARNLITSLNSRSRVRRDLINDSDSDELF